MKKRIRLTEAQLHKMIKQSMKRILKEDFENEDNKPDFYDFVELLDSNGWGYHNFADVTGRDGREGTRFVLSYNGQHCDYEILKQEILKMFPDAIFSYAQHRYAPEIQYQTVILFDI